MGDKIGIKERSIAKGPVSDLAERWQKFDAPTWMSLDKMKKEATIISDATSDDTRFNFNSIIELYSR